MKSRIIFKSTLVAVIVGSLFTPLAHAQNGQEITANIPFAFSVNRSHFEAGSYEFDLSPDKFGMSVVNLETGKKQFVTVHPQGHSLSSEPAVLIFSRSGEDQYLSEVQFSATDSSRLNVPRKSDIHDRNTILRGVLRK
ncbi:hypothetical protein [Edaphobacter albus]|uniref:hypothetical protein n=1 Tax=Edaphobacter sp. 4G125 TaxID=2763071 RepID=UPI001647D8A8|nr:hypothetical protein [Edaphobacter sp. 4G125]QNI35233.1 hypothetical protein H7846_08915 [Edaphobacter sp. 4G125]